MEHSLVQIVDSWLVIGQTDEGGPSMGASPEQGTGNVEGADGSAANPGAPTGGGAPAGPSAWIIWIPLIFLFGFMIWSSSSTQRKEKKRREEMLTGLNKHDRVQTVGGVIGSIVEVKDDEIVLKVDEANNIKMRFARSAVQQVISDSSGTETKV